MAAFEAASTVRRHPDALHVAAFLIIGRAKTFAKCAHTACVQLLTSDQLYREFSNAVGGQSNLWAALLMVC
jgi:hypothetical protein